VYALKNQIQNLTYLIFLVFITKDEHKSTVDNFSKVYAFAKLATTEGIELLSLSNRVRNLLDGCLILSCV